MISLEDYVGPWSTSEDWTAEKQANAVALLLKCGDLENEMLADSIVFPINPKTKSGVSGEVYGGFRPQSCPIGASLSAHKQGLAVDRYDPDNKIDAWCLAHQDRLKEHGIYIEHPDSTPHWSHWTIRAPGSGHTVFYP